MKIKNLIFICVVIFTFSVYSQSTYKKTVWDEECDCAVKYATINSDVNDYVISNEEGVFTFKTNNDYATIRMLGYKVKKINLKDVTNDTIYLKPKLYELEEVVIVSDGYFKSMIKSIPKNYALQPHTEKFYLRAILKRNNQIIKAIDLSGKVRKETLFNTMSVPMPKKNYTVQVENIRKAGKIFRDYDFTIINFKNFFDLHSSFYISPENFNIEYKSLKDNSYTKVIAIQKEKKTTSNQKGYFFVNNKTKNFEQANIFTEFFDGFVKIDKNLKNRTVFYDVTSDFTKNPFNNKLQINKCKINIQVEILNKDKLDKFDLSFIYFANPIKTNPKIKNNVKQNKDIFDLKFKYDEKYWQKQEKLPLTKEMQEFINEINSKGKYSDFKTKTNINR
jgi:hypothetical protein